MRGSCARPQGWPWASRQGAHRLVGEADVEEVNHKSVSECEAGKTV